MRRLRGRQGDHALLEGPHLIEEALACGIELESVLATAEALARPEISLLAGALRRRPLEVAPAVLDSLADSDSPRGILALARLPRGGVETIPVRDGVGVLYLDGVQDPGNVGALARVAEAFGADALALGPGSAHPNHPRALRASAGSLLRMPAAHDVAVAALDGRLGTSARWAALAAHGGVALDRLSWRRGAWVLAVGAEGAGLSPEVERRVDERWTIPLAGRVESLNVAVAAGVALYAFAAARRRLQASS
jgi:TrmH family RNA methyltransferase